MFEFWQQFHFLRPQMLLLAPALAVWLFFMWRLPAASPWSAYLKPAFISAFTPQRKLVDQRRQGMVAASALLLWVLALAGPSWHKVSTPFSQDSATVIIALELSEAMRVSDLQADRLSHAKLKIASLLARRGNAKTGLIVYAGSAHVLIPPTEDTASLLLYLHDLQPELMPVDGANTVAAYALAQQLLAGNRGRIVFVGSGVGGAWPLADHAQAPLYWQISSEPLLDKAVAYRADQHDTDRVLAAIARSQQSIDGLKQTQWHDSGYYLLIPLVLLLLVLYRQGAVQQWL